MDLSSASWGSCTWNPKTLFQQAHALPFICLFLHGLWSYIIHSNSKWDTALISQLVFLLLLSLFMQRGFKRTACVESRGHGWHLRLSRTNWPCVVNVLSVNQAWPSVKSEPLLAPCFPSTIRERQMFLSSLVFSKLGWTWTPLIGGLKDAKDNMDGWETPCAHLSKQDGRVGSPLKFI